MKDEERRLTEKEAIVLAYIRDYTRRHALPPSSREIAANFRFYRNRGNHYQRRLFLKGYLYRVRRLYLPHPDGDR